MSCKPGKCIDIQAPRPEVKGRQHDAPHGSRFDGYGHGRGSGHVVYDVKYTLFTNRETMRLLGISDYDQAKWGLRGFQRDIDGGGIGFVGVIKADSKQEYKDAVSRIQAAISCARPFGSEQEAIDAVMAVVNTSGISPSLDEIPSLHRLGRFIYQAMRDFDKWKYAREYNSHREPRNHRR